MALALQNKVEQDGVMQFTIRGIDVSIINAIRRTILSDIPSVVFRGFPYSENKITITKNTTRHTNEMVKQRLGCVPIHLKPDFPYSNYTVELSSKNTGTGIIYATTGEFKILDKTSGNYVSEVDTKKIFPPNAISKGFIPVVRLRNGPNNQGEEIVLSCELSTGTGGQDGMYTVASQCFFTNTIDPAVNEEEWQNALKDIRATTPDITEAQVEKERRNWMFLEGKRHFIANSFDFTLETIGVYTNDELVETACTILLDKLNNLKTITQSDKLKIDASETTIDNCYDVILEDEDYTIGNMLQTVMFKELHERTKVLSFCGFKKFHPHDDHSVLRLAFVNDEPRHVINEYIVTMTENLTQQFSNVIKEFQSLK